MSKTLYFEGAGMEGTGANDVENYRIRTAFENDKGEKIYLEIMNGGGKHKGEMIIDTCLYIKEDDNKYEEKYHMPLENKIFGDYTKTNILKFVNKNLHSSFDEVKILSWFSGYSVFTKTERGCNRYFLMNDYVDIPERTEARKDIFYYEAKEYFNKIYQDHIKKNPSAAHLYEEGRQTWSLVSMDDTSITVRSYTYDKLVDENQRIKTFKVEY